jgi:hypothetical protein
MSTVWPTSSSRRAVSRPSPLFAPVIRVIVTIPLSPADYGRPPAGEFAAWLGRCRPGLQPSARCASSGGSGQRRRMSSTPGQSVVGICFSADRGGATVLVEHSGFASERSMTRHRASWNGTLASLGQAVFPTSSTRNTETTSERGTDYARADSAPIAEPRTQARRAHGS